MKGKILIIVMVIVILAVLGIGGYLLWNKMTVDKTSPTPNQTGTMASVNLIDAYSAQLIVNAEVTVRSNNGTVCIMAPCPNESQSWTSKSDSGGTVEVPKSKLNKNNYIEALGYGGSSLNNEDILLGNVITAELVSDSQLNSSDRGKYTKFMKS